MKKSLCMTMVSKQVRACRRLRYVIAPFFLFFFLFAFAFFGKVIIGHIDNYMPVARLAHGGEQLQRV